MTSQLAFAAVTLEQARAALESKGWDLEQAASKLLADAGM